MDEHILGASLHHVVTAETHVTNKVEDVYDSLGLHLPQHCVDGYEGTSTTYTSTVCVCVGGGGGGGGGV